MTEQQVGDPQVAAYELWGGLRSLRALLTEIHPELPGQYADVDEMEAALRSAETLERAAKQLADRLDPLVLKVEG